MNNQYGKYYQTITRLDILVNGLGRMLTDPNINGDGDSLTALVHTYYHAYELRTRIIAKATNEHLQNKYDE
jgi:hypothetical protein